MAAAKAANLSSAGSTLRIARVYAGSSYCYSSCTLPEEATTVEPLRSGSPRYRCDSGGARRDRHHSFRRFSQQSVRYHRFPVQPISPLLWRGCPSCGMVLLLTMQCVIRCHSLVLLGDIIPFSAPQPPDSSEISPGSLGPFSGCVGKSLLLNSPCPVVDYMADYLSESDLKRMAEFASTPKYKRDPELLVPTERE